MAIGSFLFAVHRGGASPGSEALCDAADRLAVRALGVCRASRFTAAGGTLSLYGRAADPRVAIATDIASGRWLVTLGTWLHEDAAVSSDDALLARLTRVGAKALARELQGFYVVIAGNRELRDVSVITDLIGSCRAYWCTTRDGIAVSSSSLLLAAVSDTRLDAVGCQEFLGTGIVYEDRTVYAGIRKLAPACVHRYRDATASSTPYWSVAELAADTLHGAEAVERFSAHIVDAARRIALRYDNPVCDLTGGYDSRGLVSGMLAGGLNFTATVSGPENSPDVRISRELAALAGLPHLHSPATAAASPADVRSAFALTHGEYDVLDYARIWKTHGMLAERFRLSLNGSYGEVARGYWWELLIGHTGARRPLDCALVARKRFAPGFDASLILPRARLDAAAHFTDIARRTNAGLEGEPNTLQMDHLYLMMRMRCWQGAIASSTNRLWPCLSPFMTRPVLETMLQAAPRMRARSLLMRQAIARLQPALARHPLEQGHPAMPATLGNLYRFLPLGAHYGHKVAQKAARTVARVTSRRAGAPTRTNTPASLDPGIRELIGSPSPRLADVVDAPVLERMAAGELSATPGTASSRLLTLQLALHTLETTHRQE